MAKISAVPAISLLPSRVQKLQSKPWDPRYQQLNLSTSSLVLSAFRGQVLPCQMRQSRCWKMSATALYLEQSGMSYSFMSEALHIAVQTLSVSAHPRAKLSAIHRLS